MTGMAILVGGLLVMCLFLGWADAQDEKDAARRKQELEEIQKRLDK